LFRFHCPVILGRWNGTLLLHRGSTYILLHCFTHKTVLMLETKEILTRLAIAALLGGCVGVERQRYDWAAGLRTHMLVCVGSALVMLVSAFGFSDVLGKPAVVLDPSRIAAQVVSGIGFLGAGTILFLRQEVVRGLTTAAGIWSVAAIGLAVGGGLYLAATAATVIVLIILAVIKPVERRFFEPRKVQKLRIVSVQADASLEQIAVTIKKAGVQYTEITLHAGMQPGTDEILVRCSTASSREKILQAMDLLRKVPGIKEIDLHAQAK
jgi:putative Mg2+ transporter-C (MgtC) family protein